MATARLDFRCDSKIKSNAEKAAALLGMNSLTEYVINLIEEDSSKVIAQHESILVKEDIFDRFNQACEEAKKPNQALQNALKFARSQGY